MIESVKEFQEKFGFAMGKRLEKTDDISKALRKFGAAVSMSAGSLQDVALKAQKDHGDERAYRVYLMVEELSEIVTALGQRDYVDLCDGLTDLLYVVLGTALTYGVPLDELFKEVHHSNMSKTRDADDPRMRAKDPVRGYFPPDIIGVIRRCKS